MKKTHILRKAAALLLAGAMLAGTVSAASFSKESVLEFGEYAAEHDYMAQRRFFYNELMGDGEAYILLQEEELNHIKSGKNAILSLNYCITEKPSKDWYTDEPCYSVGFVIMMNDGRCFSSSSAEWAELGQPDFFDITEKSGFTVKEILEYYGVNDPENILLFLIDITGDSVFGYDCNSYSFIPCKSGWNERRFNEYYSDIYYVKSDGTPATSSCTINGIRYKFGKNGVCGGKYTGWTKNSKGLRYWKDGVLQKNTEVTTESGKTYTIDKNGYAKVKK